MGAQEEECEEAETTCHAGICKGPVRRNSKLKSALFLIGQGWEEDR
jgi:hypothetical protein